MAMGQSCNNFFSGQSSFPFACQSIKIEEAVAPPLCHSCMNDPMGQTLQQCTKLVVIDLGENKLDGAIPTWISKSLTSLQVLHLRSNEFNGIIPIELGLITSLQVLDLAYNNLTGYLPPSVGNLGSMITIHNESDKNALSISNLISSYYMENVVINAKGQLLNFTATLTLVTSIDLSNNNLYGEIPKELTHLHGLYFLNLSNNYFSGGIPKSIISEMKELESLDLSWNNLSGTIPSSMSELYFLSELNLSYNNFVGKIPTSSQLQTFTSASYIGNTELCGLPLATCPSDRSTKEGREEEDKGGDGAFDNLGYFFGFALGFIVGFWGFVGVVMSKRSLRIRYIILIDNILGSLVGVILAK